MLTEFRERGWEGEKQQPAASLSRANPPFSRASDTESNRSSGPRLTLQPTEPHRPGAPHSFSACCSPGAVLGARAQQRTKQTKISLLP